VIGPAQWVRENVAVYLGNATAMRDYRTQLRGNRAILLWSIYLAVLIGFSMLVYSFAVGAERMSVAQAQQVLSTFFASVMGLLATMIIVVTPAFTATAVVGERERRSLDLVFSAPVTPKYFLVGKMIAGYRYTWMLLALSLPVTATCVVLGGSTWAEVLIAYVLLSMHALLFTSIALLVSTLAGRHVSALLWSYIVIGTFILVVSIVGTFFMFGFWSQGGEASFLLALNPYSASTVASTHSMIAGVAVPNWILGGLFILAVSRLLLLGAGAALSHYGSGEVKSLRINGVVYAFLLVLWLAHTLADSGWGLSLAHMIGVTVAWSVVLLFPLMPFLVCFGTDLERKYWPNGLFSWRSAWRGTPAGALPYLLILLLAMFAAASLGAYLATSRLPEPGLLGFVAWGVGFVLLIWAFGRLSSVMVQGLRAARALHLFWLLGVFVFPLPLLAMVLAIGPGSADESSLWNVYPLYPLLTDENPARRALAMGVIMSVGALLIVLYSEKRELVRFGAFRRNYVEAE
jgi:ABC-type transport system involved in multi-copper enzyme maturation permease subunit